MKRKYDIYDIMDYVLCGMGLIILGFLAVIIIDCALMKQAQVDYEQCLAWQDEGYNIQCREPN